MAVERGLLSSMAPRRVLVGLFIAFSLAGPARAQADRWPECAEHPSTSVTLPNGYPFDADRAVALFRFHRQAEALQELDAGRAIVRGPWRWRIPADQRKEISSRLDALRNCLATTEPPELATLSVRVLGRSPFAADNMTPQEDARVYVEGVPVGRTDSNGTLTARVPSGPIGVEVGVPIDQWGWADVSLGPDQSEVIEIPLAEDKEVDEHTRLVLAEAIDDILPVNAGSMTLKFTRDGRRAPVTRIDDIEVLDRDGNTRATLEEQFRVVRGEIVAMNAARVFDVLAPEFDDTIVLRVLAIDAEEGMHHGEIAFRVARWPLSVRLEGPPSNPTLSVSNIEVGISLPGGFAVQRVSDANGRFEVESFPSGTITFDCATVSDGTYYYGQATLDHSGPGSVTLVLRGVRDVIDGVRPLRVDFQDIIRRPSRR